MLIVILLRGEAGACLEGRNVDADPALERGKPSPSGTRRGSALNGWRRVATNRIKLPPLVVCPFRAHANAPRGLKPALLFHVEIGHARLGVVELVDGINLDAISARRELIEG